VKCKCAAAPATALALALALAQDWCLFACRRVVDDSLTEASGEERSESSTACNYVSPLELSVRAVQTAAFKANRTL